MDLKAIFEPLGIFCATFSGTPALCPTLTTAMREDTNIVRGATRQRATISVESKSGTSSSVAGRKSEMFRGIGLMYTATQGIDDLPLG